jgi:hypothetical protein
MQAKLKVVTFAHQHKKSLKKIFTFTTCNKRKMVKLHSDCGTGNESSYQVLV